MNQNIISAVFDSRAGAERAVSDLRAAGVSESAVSIIAQRDGDNATATDGAGTVRDDGGTGSGMAKGLGIGAGVGALFGLAALAIPGVGPFIAAGALAQAFGAAGGAVAAGAIVGGTAGGLSGALMNYGVSEEDSRYYEERIGNGGVFVSVDTSSASIDSEKAWDILARAGGHSASRQPARAL
jgi:hypothetical protein